MHRVGYLGISLTVMLALSAVVHPAGAVDDDLPRVFRASPPNPPSMLEVGQYDAFMGLRLPSAPKLAPGNTAKGPDPTVRDIQLHLRAGDTERAFYAAHGLTKDQHWGKARDTAWLVKGLLYREAGHHNLASEAFT
ncbi:MAG: hypothetical protein HN348_26170, partial [Proteobacteria bacterium]|nr:hypothetical protein [Pseudomonadota bacterium]